MPKSRTPVRRAALVIAVLAAAVGLTGCVASAVSGVGRDAATSVLTPDFPSNPASAVTEPSGASVAPTTPAGAPTPTGASSGHRYEQAITVTGSSTGRTYRALIWDTDNVTDCAGHAYGAVMVKFLRRHPCGPTHRVLATIALGSRTVAISMISTSFAGSGADIYGPVGQFRHLRLADGTGSMDDLLRDGGYLPGFTAIPFREAFEVNGQDTGVTIFDAWYTTGHTNDQDPTLVTLEMDLFGTELPAA